MQEAETTTRMPRTKAVVKTATVETPTHLLGWLPMLWTRVLFGGPAAPTPWRAWPSMFIFVVSGILLYPRACRFRCSSRMKRAMPRFRARC